MQATVIKTFADKETYRLHLVGETVDFDEARVEDLAARGLVEVEVAADAAEPVKKARKTTAKTKKQ